MLKKILIVVGAVVLLFIAYKLISPLWTKVVLDEALPVVKDNLVTMGEEEKTDFEQQTNEMKDKIMTMTDTMPTNEPVVLSSGEMVARAHEVEGTAMFIKSGEENFLRFENLKTINGPDLFIYLSADLSAEDFINLGAIRATEGNVNYAIPAGTDLSKYKYAMIWCRAFGVLFSYASL